jgi:hypothetical protein
LYLSGTFHDGNLDAGKAMLRDFINATITFPNIAQKLYKSSKSIHRMLGPSGMTATAQAMGMYPKRYKRRAQGSNPVSPASVVLSTIHA